jgi:hypothetical protein
MQRGNVRPLSKHQRESGISLVPMLTFYRSERFPTLLLWLPSERWAHHLPKPTLQIDGCRHFAQTLKIYDDQGWLAWALSEWPFTCFFWITANFAYTAPEAFAFGFSQLFVRSWQIHWTQCWPGPDFVWGQHWIACPVLVFSRNSWYFGFGY